MLKKLALSVVLASSLIGGVACVEDSTKAPAAENKPVNTENYTFAQKSSVALGTMYGENLAQGMVELNNLDLGVDKDLLVSAFVAALEGKPQINLEDAQNVLKELDQQARTKAIEKMKAEAAANKAKGDEFLAKNKTAEGVITTESGLQYKITQEGTGATPTASDRIKVTYKGSLIDGTEFDKSSEPVEFFLNQVVKGWQEAFQLLKVGSKATLYIPAELGYGDHAMAKIPANSVLVFDVELLDITTPAPAAEAAPDDAEKAAK